MWEATIDPAHIPIFMQAETTDRKKYVHKAVRSYDISL